MSTCLHEVQVTQMTSAGPLDAERQAERDMYYRAIRRPKWQSKEGQVRSIQNAIPLGRPTSLHCCSIATSTLTLKGLSNRNISGDVSEACDPKIRRFGPDGDPRSHPLLSFDSIACPLSITRQSQSFRQQAHRMVTITFNVSLTFEHSCAHHSLKRHVLDTLQTCNDNMTSG